ncbi:MAG: histidine kinase [Chloroflexota bacterium]|nr:histidine kinase [Chloroflexota bacterium]
MKRYFTSNLSPFVDVRGFQELKNLEWIFIGIHSLAVPALIVMMFTHEPSSTAAVGIMAGLLAAWSVIASFLNHRITTIDEQISLGLTTQVVVVLFTWAIISQLVSGANTAAYGGFAIVIVEGAIRYGLRGSMVMSLVFALGLVAAMFYRDWEYGLAFDIPGYIFWTVLLTVVALSLGLVTEEIRHERRGRETLVKENTLIEERSRIARDLHDTVLKTLHGIALEAHTLKKRADSPPVIEKAEYIQGVCQRSSREIRDIIDELRSEGQSEGIVAQMARVAESWNSITGIDIDFTLSGEDRNLSLIANYHIKNVLSEALVNIQKHASASHVSILVESLPGEIRLEIADNGIGIGYSGDDVYMVAAKGKYGLLGMKERIEQLNGQFYIDGQSGTRLLISVPLISAG